MQTWFAYTLGVYKWGYPTAQRKKKITWVIWGYYHFRICIYVYDISVFVEGSPQSPTHVTYSLPRIRRYCDITSKKKVTASKECLELWKSETGRPLASSIPNLYNFCSSATLFIHETSDWYNIYLSTSWPQVPSSKTCCRNMGTSVIWRCKLKSGQSGPSLMAKRGAGWQSPTWLMFANIQRYLAACKPNLHFQFIPKQKISNKKAPVCYFFGDVQQ